MRSFRGTTLVEREQLHDHKSPILSGFQPRRLRQLAVKHPPRNDTNIDCCHILRSDTWRLPGYLNLDQGQKLWEQVGDHLPDFPDADVSYDSNVWRNFRVSEMSKEHTLNEIIALANPIKLPAPSKLGKYTYASYLVQTNIGPDESFKKKLIAASHKQDEHNRMMKLQSDFRNPPTDRYGNIEPPKDFQKYPAWEKPKLSQNDKVQDIKSSVTKQPTRVWRLSYRQNTPNHQLVQTARRAKFQHPRKMIHSINLHHGVH